MKFLIVVLTLLIGHSGMTEDSQYLSKNVHNMEDFETECVIKAAVIGNMDCPNVKKYKLLVEMTDTELVQSLENSSGKSFQEVDLLQVLDFYKEFEANIKLPVATQYRSQFLNLVKSSKSFNFIVAFHRGLLKRDYAHVIAYSTEKKIILSFDINLRY